MTSKARYVIADILIIAEERLIPNRGRAFTIISQILWEYYKLWGFVD